MFRSISKTLDHKKIFIERQKTQQSLAQEIVEGFIKEIIGLNNKLTRRVIYNPEQKQLLIEVGSKTLASELLLKAGEISALLHQKNITTRQLIIR